ncbi:valine--pyruvate transaminase [Desulfopila aestuarii]|uniref:Valine-pyruvate aminotransferase apoenzyme n=1 Tax=Desulfopila aestuarii DSM 18488 TaxID=1121416 RepID=A0A1M7YD65_9BACT|nr:valine--pyruvate transaminase [Desulfopila aestuarii]SHO50531.1 valine-pyruvate aminotransferase apoenzyme [Desulfopila aestuarii DSM 18488]
MKFSEFGQQLTCNAGILSLMDDLGEAKATGGDNMIMMGGGNPGVVPEFQDLLRKRLRDICDDPCQFHRLIGAYDPPQGESAFVAGLARMLRQELGWQLGPENICLTNGSQTAFFMLFNLFAGRYGDGTKKKICLPLAPEYIGYADLGITDDFFVSTRPVIEKLEDNLFKYHVDFDKLSIGPDIGAICVSRPTNPTGNVVTDEELARLDNLAKKHSIPLIVDNAYGVPFPSMVYGEATPIWNENMVVCFSLSKLGLPAVRTGIIVARPEITRALASMNAIMSLSPGSFGAVLAEGLVKSGDIIEISRRLIRPFYQQKMERALAVVRREFAGVPWRVHKPEGAMFLWLWFEEMPITSHELYERLKRRGVLVVSGHYFYPGIQDEWRHRDECIRATYSQNDDDVARGLAIIAEEVKKAYGLER